MSVSLVVLCKVYKIDFWLGNMGALSPKRLRLRSNCPFIAQVVEGCASMPKEKMKELAAKGERTTHQYVDASGRKRCAGTKFLKRSQCGP